jgi:hypothetical protein
MFAVRVNVDVRDGGGKWWQGICWPSSLGAERWEAEVS